MRNTTRVFWSWLALVVTGAATIATSPVEPLAVADETALFLVLHPDQAPGPPVARTALRITASEAVLDAPDGFEGRVRLSACIASSLESGATCAEPVDGGHLAGPAVELRVSREDGSLAVEPLALQSGSSELAELDVLEAGLDETLQLSVSFAGEPDDAPLDSVQLILTARAELSFPGLDPGGFFTPPDDVPPGAQVTVQEVEVAGEGDEP